MPLFRNLDESADLQTVDSLDETYENVEGGEGITDTAAFLEALIVDRVASMNEAERNEYMNSEEFKYLEEAGVVGRKAIVRMSKQADLDRRVMLAAMQMAREKGDNDFELLRKNRIKERQLLDRIYKKYNNMVRRDAKKAQQKLIKLSPRAFDMTKVVR
jgi:hypothetical protein